MGLILVYVELFLLPGVFIVGIFGGLSMTIGVYLAYDFFGTTGGGYTLGISLAFFIAMMVLGYRKITSKKWTLNEKIKSKVKIVEESKVNVGDKGTTFSVLKPAGKVLINGERIEAHSLGELIQTEVEIEIVKIEQNKIFVKPVSAKKE